MLAPMRWLVLVFLLGCPPPPEPVLPRPSDRTLALVEASRDLDGVVVGAGPAAPSATIVVVFASWCGHCKVELAVVGALRSAHPRVRILGVNYRGHEEYDGRGDAQAVRAYVASSAPWLRVVPAGEPLFDALGRPPMVPTLYVYDRAGTLAARYDRRERAMPDAGELGGLLRRLGG